MPRAESPDQRRARLLARSAELRNRLGAQSQALARPLHLADRGVAWAHWARINRAPLLAAGAGLAAVVLLRRPRRLIGLAGSVWSLWRIAQRAAPVMRAVARLQQRSPPR